MTPGVSELTADGRGDGVGGETTAVKAQATGRNRSLFEGPNLEEDGVQIFF
jgi:hypothetical protein